MSVASFLLSHVFQRISIFRTEILTFKKRTTFSDHRICMWEHHGYRDLPFKDSQIFKNSYKIQFWWYEKIIPFFSRDLVPKNLGKIRKKIYGFFLISKSFFFVFQDFKIIKSTHLLRTKPVSPLQSVFSRKNTLKNRQHAGFDFFCVELSVVLFMGKMMVPLKSFVRTLYNTAGSLTHSYAHAHV